MTTHTRTGSVAFALGLAVAAAAALALAPRSQAQPAPAASPPADAAAPPLAQLGLFLDAFHVRDGHPDEQMEAVHYCGQVSPDLHQCALFDGAGETAKLIGVEYVISAAALNGLPMEERALWHSHAYEVTSGMLMAPGLPSTEERPLMQTLAGTYGKTWHTWQVHSGDALPLGRPALMMSFTKDGQLEPQLVERRDAALGISTEAVKTRRADIRPPPLLPDVDRGEQGESCPGVKGRVEHP